MDANIINKAAQLGLCALSCYCAESLSDPPAGFDDVLIPGLTPEDVLAHRTAFESGMLDLMAAGETVRWELVSRQFNLGSLAQWALTLCAAVYAEPRSAGLLGVLLGSGTVTLDAAAEVMKGAVGERYDFKQKRAAYSQLNPLLCLDENGNKHFTRRALELDERLAGFLQGDDVPDPSLSGLCRLASFTEPLTPLMTGREQMKKIAEALNENQLAGGVGFVQLSGDEGCGRRFLLAHACTELSVDRLCIDWPLMEAVPPELMRNTVRRLRREIIFYQPVVVVAPVAVAEGGEALFKLRGLDCCLEKLTGLGATVAVCTERDMPLMALTKQPVREVALSAAERGARIELWEGYARFFRLAGLDHVALGTKYKLTASAISRVAEALARRITKNGDGLAALAEELAISISRQRTEQAVRIERPAWSFDALKLPDAKMSVLRAVCAHVQHRNTVLDVWGMERLYPYGKNVSALFAGPPGTGKTMAAHCVAKELNLPLMQVDLSQVVDKYIGESEKHLKRIFELAERTSTVLFFDEADAIFGKRSEVKDARDRYANTEVSYVLQRVEAYDGIVLLASNNRNNVDDAFMRRIRYVLDFELPDESLRLSLWQAALPPELPRESIDYTFLARNFELSGGSIKNIVLNAAFHAASDGNKLGMSHLLFCLRAECAKTGKNLFAQDFKEYANLIVTQ